MKNIILIPSRYNSSRLPKKSLAKIISKEKNQTLIEHVFKRCQNSKLYDDIYILTDHKDIVKEVNKFTKNVLMTDQNLASGTDRVYQGATLLNANDDDFIINIQGDCALLDASLIDDLILEYKKRNNNYDMITFVSKITNKDDLLNVGEVKVVLDNNKKAIYFSRSPIPYLREKEDENIVTYYKHLGIYGYSYKFLKTFVNLKIGNLEQIERLEQLRAIENGYSIETILTDKTIFDINYQKDIDKLNQILAT